MPNNFLNTFAIKKYRVASVLILAVMVLNIVIANLPEIKDMAYGLDYGNQKYLLRAITYIFMIALLFLLYKEVAWVKYILLVYNLYCLYLVAQVVVSRGGFFSRVDYLEFSQLILFITAQIVLFQKPKPA